MLLVHIPSSSPWCSTLLGWSTCNSLFRKMLRARTTVEPGLSMIFRGSAEAPYQGSGASGWLAPGESAMKKNIAADSGIPAHFLAKILQDLARYGFLESNKGPRGGFRLPPACRGNSALLEGRRSGRRRLASSALHRGKSRMSRPGCVFHARFLGAVAVPCRRMVDRNLDRRSGEIPVGEKRRLLAPAPPERALQSLGAFMQNSVLVPMVGADVARRARVRLIPAVKENIIFLGTPIDDNVADR